MPECGSWPGRQFGARPRCGQAGAADRDDCGSGGEPATARQSAGEPKRRCLPVSYACRPFDAVDAPAFLFGGGKREPELLLQGAREHAANRMALPPGGPCHLGSSNPSPSSEVDQSGLASHTLMLWTAVGLVFSQPILSPNEKTTLRLYQGRNQSANVGDETPIYLRPELFSQARLLLFS